MALCKWLSIATELIPEFFDEGAPRVRCAVVQKFYRSVLKFQYTISELCESGCDRVQASAAQWGVVANPIMVPMSSPVAELAPPEIISKYEAVIGLEVHVQLATASKIFCGCPTSFGAPPNTNVCPVCLGLPGALPVLSREAVEMAMRAAMALNCSIRSVSRFARKNYFYPDLPKGYQISQYDEPLGERGWAGISVDGTQKRIGITRVH